MPAPTIADVTAVQSLATLAISSGMTYDKLEAILQFSFALGPAANGRYIVSVGDGPTNMVTMSADGMMLAIEKVRQFKAQDAGPVVMATEFAYPDA